MARIAHIASTALITAGLVVLADVGLTLAYKEPISSFYGSIKQGQAADQLNELNSRYPAEDDLLAVAEVKGVRRKVKILARRFARVAEDGKGIGRIKIATMDDLNVVIVQGTDTGTLQKGPGHYPDTPFPGAGGTSAIAGHRTTYLAPFRQIDSVEVGDPITLEMPYATLSYEVEKTFIVEPSDVEVIRRVDHERLVLTACHPLYSADQRYVIFARLTDVELAG